MTRKQKGIAKKKTRCNHRYVAVDDFSLKRCKFCGKIKEPPEYNQPFVLYCDTCGDVVQCEESGIYFLACVWRMSGWGNRAVLMRLERPIWEIPKKVREQIWRRLISNFNWNWEPQLVNQRVIPITRRGYKEFITRRGYKEFIKGGEINERERTKKGGTRT